jgi:hypothetical protein
MSISLLDKKQWVSVLKALAYAFVSAFAVGFSSTGELNKAALLAGAVAGFNACLVVIKKLFTEVE